MERSGDPSRWRPPSVAATARRCWPAPRRPLLRRPGRPVADPIPTPPPPRDRRLPSAPRPRPPAAATSRGAGCARPPARRNGPPRGRSDAPCRRPAARRRCRRRAASRRECRAPGRSGRGRSRAARRAPPRARGGGHRSPRRAPTGCAGSPLRPPSAPAGPAPLQAIPSRRESPPPPRGGVREGDGGHGPPYPRRRGRRVGRTHRSGSRSGPDPHGLDVHELADAELGQLAAVARLP